MCNSQEEDVRDVLWTFCLFASLFFGKVEKVIFSASFGKVFVEDEDWEFPGLEQSIQAAYPL